MCVSALSGKPKAAPYRAPRFRCSSVPQYSQVNRTNSRPSRTSAHLMCIGIRQCGQVRCAVNLGSSRLSCGMIRSVGARAVISAPAVTLSLPAISQQKAQGCSRDARLTSARPAVFPPPGQPWISVLTLPAHVPASNAGIVWALRLIFHATWNGAVRWH